MTSRFRHSLLLVLVIGTLHGGCSSDPAAEPRCIPGESSACTCADATSGAQVCTAESIYGACQCLDDVDASVGEVDAGGDASVGEVDAGVDSPPPPRHTLRITKTGRGEIRLSPPGQSCQPASPGERCATYDSDVTVTISLGSVAYWYQVQTWTGDCSYANGISRCTLQLSTPGETSIAMTVKSGGVIGARGVGVDSVEYLSCLSANTAQGGFAATYRFVGDILWSSAILRSSSTTSSAAVLRGFADAYAAVALRQGASDLLSGTGAFNVGACAQNASSDFALLGAYSGRLTAVGGQQIDAGSSFYNFAFGWPSASSPWLQSINTSTSVLYADAIASFAQDYVLSGTIAGSAVSVGGAPLQPPGERFVKRMSASGLHQWSAPLFQAATGSQYSTVALSASTPQISIATAVRQAGTGSSTLTAAGTIYSLQVEPTIIVQGLAPDTGSPRWSHGITTVDSHAYEDVQLADIATGSGGETYVTGRYSGGTLSVDQQAFMSADLADGCFLVRFEGDGSLGWVRHFPRCGRLHVTLLADGRPVVAGSVDSNGDFGFGAVCPGFVYGCVFAARLGQDGVSQWVRRVGRNTAFVTFDDVVATSSAIVVAGTFAGTLEFDTVSLHATSDGDSFLAALGEPEAAD